MRPQPESHLEPIVPWWAKILLGLYTAFVVAFMALILFGLFLAVHWLNQHIG